MFEDEQQIIETKIREFCKQNEIPIAEPKWSPIPFSGEWGISTSFFATAALEARAGSEGVRTLRLETGVNNHAALGLYARAGFTRCDPFGDYRPDPLSVFMQKDL